MRGRLEGKGETPKLIAQWTRDEDGMLLVDGRQPTAVLLLLNGRRTEAEANEFELALTFTFL